MKMKDTTRRSVRFLFSIRRYLIFFLLMAFVITCCMILFLNMMTRATGFELTQKYIEQAAKVTFLNVALLSLLCTVIDGIRRRIMVKRPVKRIVSAAEQIMKGDFSVRIPSLRSADKMSGFDVIADYFNQMAEELSGTETLRTDFIANVSHELKTPLTSILGISDMLKNGMVASEDIKGFAEDINKETSRLISLVNDIIKLSELDEDKKRDTGRVNLYEVAQDVAERIEPVAAKQGISISVTGTDAVINAGDSLIFEMIYNLCDNAVKYNRENGSVTVSTGVSDGKAFVSVKDTGIGIPAAEQERVFERFYRVDKGRSKQSGGTGLGLSIVKHIAVTFGGTIKISSEEGTGTEVTVVFSEM